jgi:hypothetical protein
VTNKTGSSSDECIYYNFQLQPLLITLTYRQYSAIAHLHHLQITVAHAVGFFVFTSRFLATDLNIGTITESLNAHSKYHTEIKSSNHA